MLVTPGSKRVNLTTPLLQPKAWPVFGFPSSYFLHNFYFNLINMTSGMSTIGI